MPNLTFVGIGAAHIDRRGRMAGPFVPGASNPGTVREEAGGAVLNALRTMVNLGAEADIVSAIGGDSAGRQIAAVIAEAGIGDHCAVFLDRSTASYTALIDADGSLLAGLADMNIYENALSRHLRSRSVRDLATACNAVLFDANIPEDGISHLVRACKGKPLYAIAVSPAKAIRLKPHMSAITAIFMNRRESLALTGLPENAGTPDCVRKLREMGLQGGVISDGASAVTGFDRNAALQLLPPQPPQVVDVTGAGDALAAAAIVALTSGKAIGDALREGTAAAIAAIMAGPAVPVLDRKLLDRLLESVPAAVPMERAV
jgi:sugar/nucleoside kinase (ribokinase family)